MKRNTKQKETFSCRFPGCNAGPFSRTQERGLHELRAHKMRGGVVPEPEAPVILASAAPEIPKAPEEILPGTFIDARSHLEQAIEQLNRQERDLNIEIDRLEALRAKSDEIGRQKEVLSEALTRIVDEAPKPAVSPVNVHVHGATTHSRAHSE